MKSVIYTLKEKIDSGVDCCLVTIMATEGSSPRKGRAYMLVAADGTVCGTIGGGISEFTSANKAKELLEAKRGDMEWEDLMVGGSLGAVCGGKVLIAYYYLNAEIMEVKSTVNGIYEFENSGDSYWLELPYKCECEVPKVVKELSPGLMEEAMKHKDIHRFSCGAGDNRVTYEEHLYDGIVYCIGAGHVAQALIPLLCWLEFKCVVVDDRKEFAKKELFPDDCQVICCEYDRINEILDIQKKDYVLVMTKGHKGDKKVDMFLLSTDAHYIGSIGSKSKARAIRNDLLAEGYSEEMVDRIISPIGLPIGGDTPREVALSIAAQLVACRSGKSYMEGVINESSGIK